MNLVLDVDGRRNEVDAPAETALLYVLRFVVRAALLACLLYATFAAAADRHGAVNHTPLVKMW